MGLSDDRKGLPPIETILDRARTDAFDIETIDSSSATLHPVQREVPAA